MSVGAIVAEADNSSAQHRLREAEMEAAHLSLSVACMIVHAFCAGRQARIVELNNVTSANMADSRAQDS